MASPFLGCRRFSEDFFRDEEGDAPARAAGGEGWLSGRARLRCGRRCPAADDLEGDPTPGAVDLERRGLARRRHPPEHRLLIPDRLTVDGEDPVSAAQAALIEGRVRHDADDHRGLGIADIGSCAHPPSAPGRSRRQREDTLERVAMSVFLALTGVAEGGA